MKLKRNYLTYEELVFTISTMLGETDVVKREIVKVGIVAQILIDEQWVTELDACDEIYNKLLELNEIETLYNVLNYKDIDKLYEKQYRELFGIETTLKVFLNSIEQKIDEYGKSVNTEDFKNTLLQFSETINKKEV